MNHFETELELLKQDFVRMWELVSIQLKRSLSALTSMDQEMAEKVLLGERRVNELDLSIEKSCENLIALYNPVAVDLRFILAMIKMNSSLEKTGDIAERIAKFVIKSGNEFYFDLINKTHALAMFEEACDLLDDTLLAFKQGDAQKAREIFKRDKYINDANKTAVLAVINSIKEDPDNIEKYLKMLSIIRRIEKVGDMSKHIAEEIIFYVEAKVIRHKANPGKNP